MIKNETREDYVSKEAMAELHQELICQYKHRYQAAKDNRRNDMPSELFQLHALKNLCDFSKLNGFNADWIYQAFAEQMNGKKETLLQSYYLGGFIAALIECDCNKNKALEEINFWLDTSKTYTENAYNIYKKLRSGYAPIEFSTLVKAQVFRIASIFINSVPKQFPKGKHNNKTAEKAYKLLEIRILHYGF